MAAGISRSSRRLSTRRLGTGHAVVFSINPIYRGETIGTYPLVFNTILHFDNLNAGRKLDPK